MTGAGICRPRHGEKVQFLTDDGRIEAFREFLRDYRSWLTAGADEEHAAARLDTDMLIAYAETADAVLTGDESNPQVHRYDIWPAATAPAAPAEPATGEDH